MGCPKSGDAKPPGMERTVPNVVSDKERHEKREKQIFKVADKEENSRCIISGGCPPDVVVEVRASKSAYGTFGFDWLRVGDSDAPIVESDIPYTQNVGYHTYKSKDAKGTIVDVHCTKDVQINGGQADFVVNTKKQNLLSGKYQTLAKIRRVDNPATPLINEEQGKSLKDTFQYKVPVITLMPKDINKNPSSINLKAVLDTMVYIGEIKPAAIALEFDTTIRTLYDERGYSYETNDRAIFKAAMTLNKENIPMSNKKDFIVIESIGTLVKDITINIVALKKEASAGFSKHPCGAFTVLRNDRVKDVNVLYIGTKVNAELNKKKIPKKAKEKYPPSIDEKALRSKLGQALVNIKKITRESTLLDMSNKITWVKVKVPNKKYDKDKHEKYLLDELNEPTTTPNPNYDASLYEKKIPNPKYDKSNPSKHSRLIDNPNYKEAPLPMELKSGIDFDNILNKMELEYYNTHYLPLGENPVDYSDMVFTDSNGVRWKGSKQSTVLGAFPLNTFRCYFLEDQAVSEIHKLVAGGGGSPGKPRSMFFGSNGENIGILAHELGHNLGLKHTFTNDADIVYKFKATDNIMDYSHKDMVFYYWQWKQMNSEGIT